MIRSGRVVIGSQAHDSQTMDIDISPQVRAIERLEEGVAAYQRNPSQTLIRDGLVQRFEFTYDISHRLLRRYLAANPEPPDLINSMNFADIIRLGNEQDPLQGDWRRWKTFHDMRARTSHSYDEQVALDSVAGIPAFLDEARTRSATVLRHG